MPSWQFRADYTRALVFGDFRSDGRHIHLMPLHFPFGLVAWVAPGAGQALPQWRTVPFTSTANTLFTQFPRNADDVCQGGLSYRLVSGCSFPASDSIARFSAPVLPSVEGGLREFVESGTPPTGVPDPGSS